MGVMCHGEMKPNCQSVDEPKLSISYYIFFSGKIAFWPITYPAKMFMAQILVVKMSIAKMLMAKVLYAQKAI